MGHVGDLTEKRLVTISTQAAAEAGARRAELSANQWVRVRLILTAPPLEGMVLLVSSVTILRHAELK